MQQLLHVDLFTLKWNQPLQYKTKLLKVLTFMQFDELIIENIAQL